VTLDLSILPDELSVCRLPAGSELPGWAVLPGPAAPPGLTSATWTSEETSVVCASSAVPPDVQAESGWRALAVAGPLDLSLTGVLSSIARPLAEAGLAIFAVSTYDTDCVLVRQSSLEAAVGALTAAGHRVAGA
jgi:hypothetical protein